MPAYAPLLHAASCMARHTAFTARLRTRRHELGAADGAVLIGVQTVELGGATFGAAGLSMGAHFLGRYLTVSVGVGGPQPLDAALNKVSLTDRLTRRLGHARLASCFRRGLRRSGAA
ncbi:hypothetical protein V8F63_07685 [Brevundimonas sp. LF-1]|uniref:hypothetical protein n=1 Tax=Brevundimonas sp. LF-1 TaxID=3126100 RepID=UPI0030E0B99A